MCPSRRLRQRARHSNPRRPIRSTGGEVQPFRNRWADSDAPQREHVEPHSRRRVARTATPTNAGSLSNKGVEDVDLTPLLTPWLQWTSRRIRAKLECRESPNGSVQSIPLAPTRWGVGLEARKTALCPRWKRALRDKSDSYPQTGSPVARFAGARASRCDSALVDGGVSKHRSSRAVSLCAADGARGGHLFSASNYWGATSELMRRRSVRYRAAHCRRRRAVTGKANTCCDDRGLPPRAAGDPRAMGVRRERDQAS
jgi:hypothetical protein